jgi:hypothetical protein
MISGKFLSVMSTRNLLRLAVGLLFSRADTAPFRAGTVIHYGMLFRRIDGKLAEPVTVIACDIKRKRRPPRDGRGLG